MIILNTNLELKMTFERLIKTMKEPVEWNGRFIVIGDYLILQGKLRSLFFQFESRKVLTNLIDIPVKEEEVIEIGTHTKVQNVLNLVLYAFGKWGLIRGVKVEQDYAQLNGLFSGVLREIGIEPGYTHENFRFFKDGIRFSYEDVVQSAIEAKEEIPNEDGREEKISRGLWHKLVWKKQTLSFAKEETDQKERQRNRLGSNFYMVSFLCPKCRNHLHMAVYPEGKEFRIETSEGGVFLARAYTCGNCHCFYTPRPETLLSEGDVYTMDFVKDEDAYTDYKELLGASADRVSNYKFNEYEEIKKRKEKLGVTEQKESLEAVCAHLDELSDAQLNDLAEKMEEGFYPMGSTEHFTDAVLTETHRRSKACTGSRQSAAAHSETAGNSAETAVQSRSTYPQGAETLYTGEAGAVKTAPAAGSPAAPAANAFGAPREAGADGGSSKRGAQRNGTKEHTEQVREIPLLRREAAKKRYTAKCDVLDRMSYAQVAEVKRELLADKSLYETEKEPFLKKIHNKEMQQKRERIQMLAKSCKGANYAKMQRITEEIERTELPREEKDSVLKPLYQEKKKRGEEEAKDLLLHMPKQMSVKQYQETLARLKGYEEVDLAPYQEILDEKRKEAQNKEISNMINRTRVTNRQRLTELMDKLKHEEFEPEILAPYIEQLEDKLRMLDENAIAKICGSPGQMTASETMEAYRKIEAGVFLPELKTNALEMLKKRLAKLKTDECELLVHKFEDGLVGRIKKNDRYHFYPARKVMAKEAAPEEYEVIQYALDTYGTTRGMFEYPILVIDTSRDRSGKEGMILTPEHIFYRTMLNAYAAEIGDIRKVHSQTGMFHSALFLELKDGNKLKIPYAVEKRELLAWGNCLEEFIRYLQEKPDSRKVTYLAKEKHEKICCFRCGYTYQGGQTCPKCGYKSNQ